MTVETTKRRGPIYAEYTSPGPAYQKKTTVGINDHCPTYLRAPAYTAGIKRRDIDNKVPGPGYSFDAHLTRRGLRETPSYTLSGRHRLRDPYITPGPGAYNTDNLKEGALSKENKPVSISIGEKTKWPFKNEAPPPNTYHIRSGIGSTALNERLHPSWSFRPRTHVGGSQYAAIKAGNPGPGSYGSVEPNVFKRSAGQYTIQGRTRVKDYNTVFANPGPGSYEALVARPDKRGPTMGVRHSSYTVPLISDVDLM